MVKQVVDKKIFGILLMKLMEVVKSCPYGEHLGTMKSYHNQSHGEQGRREVLDMQSFLEMEKFFAPEWYYQYVLVNCLLKSTKHVPLPRKLGDLQNLNGHLCRCIIHLVQQILPQLT
uniref:Uncharacterized protein n=1 Tax=Opuntia streptacantha TaxID=393608 RepID=A0A7C9ED26_OPUST